MHLFHFYGNAEQTPRVHHAQNHKLVSWSNGKNTNETIPFNLLNLFVEKMQCNQCNSDNTQRLQLVYENGTSTINTRSRSFGIGYGEGLGVGRMMTQTSGTSQTVLGKKASPPVKVPYWLTVVFVIVGHFFLFGGTTSKIFGGLLVAFGVLGFIGCYKFNKHEWPKLYKRWQESWLCHKCGNIYHQP